ncbi:hypothetical protein [Amphibacillus jilinensis]|uniref:hypothetical protein n=1 Tax=Amphibacillus jilinensis TaxID=1216008 RepID=UPI00031F981A|nr:hypothetical protein [Amphibacillus jilinensis]
MSVKKKIIIIFIFGIILISLFVKIQSDNKLDAKVETIIYQLNHTENDVYKIHKINNNQALAFYTWGYPNQDHLGVIELKKQGLIWKFNKAVSNYIEYDEVKFSCNFSAFENVKLYQGKLSNKIDEVIVRTDDNRQFKAEVIESEHGDKMWYLILEDEPFEVATFVLKDSKGLIINELEVTIDLKW